MKANELMIGDWVQIVSDAPIMPNEYHRIDWIRTGEVGLDNRKIVTYPYIQPIPLTPEILEKNGFGNEMSKYLDGDEIEIELNLDDWELENEYGFLACCYQKPITYVHELQHALRLCGIEKTIELL